MKTFKEKLELYLKAGYSALAINTDQELLVCNEIVEVSEKLNLEVKEKIGPTDEGLSSLQTLELNEKEVYILVDFQTFPFEQQPNALRDIKEKILESESEGCFFIFVGESSKILPSISSLITVLDYDLPTQDQLKTLISESQQSIEEQKEKLPKYNIDRIALSLRGLNITESKNLLYLSYLSQSKFDHVFIQDQKIQSIKKDGILEIAEPIGGIDQIGGLENLKGYMKYISSAFNGKSKETPKGVLACGIPGCGKSLFAKVIGEYMQLPTIKFDFGKVKNSLVGESQSRLRKTLKQIETLSPCVLWIDEIEKALGSVNDTSGVSIELLGILLTWMQDNTAPVFIVATANYMERLDSALLRRFNDVFAIQLPHEIERKEILSIHLKKRNYNTNDFDLDTLIDCSNGFTGSEIEKAIQQSIWKCNYNKVDLNTESIKEMFSEIKPISKVSPEQIKAIEEMIKYAKPASIPPKQKSKSLGKKKLI